MTENKRFRISQGYTDRFCHDWQNNQLLNFRETVELLNELNDECEFLKIDNEALEDGATKYAELYHKSLNENELLKSTMKEVKDLLEEEVDLFSDKATEHDINAYVELREFDNKDAYYMAISTKKAIKMLKGDVE